ncbi:MAG: PriCT-2 domain-containing protein, partial [Proteobacteria bacterium]|nr:PriCT-2 domain-containing protein [Pseudomonadota bacterium]
ITGKPITIFSEDTITIYSAEDILTKLSPYFLHDITSINTPLAKKEGEALKKAHDTKHQKKPEQRLTGNQIFRYLELIPCKNLTSDIFSRLNTPGKSARLDMSNEEEARQPWLMIGQALHSYFEGSYEGCLVWDQWSQQGNKYDEEALYSTWKSFKEVEDGITIATIVALANAQKLEFIDTTSKGLPLGTPRNFTSYMAFFDYKIRLNLINNQLDISPPRHKLNEWGLNNLDTITSLNEAAALIHGDMQLQGIPPTAFTMPKLRHYLKLHASLPENQYHPIKDYFKDMKNTWDGKSRLDDLMSTIIPPDDVNLDCIDANRLFLRKWLIQVVAAAHASQKNSFMLNLVLILIGEQGIGKTKWVKSLFPPRLREFCAGDKEVQVSTFRSDAVKLTMELTSTLICNINEIDRSFHPSTFADFKAFLDKTSEQVVLPYGDAPVVKSRQTVFIGSTNKRHFLQDVSGNRRFYLLHTKNLIDNHTIDIDQLWAEVTTYYSNGEKWWIEKNTTNPKEIKALAIQTQVNNVGMFIKNEAIYEKLDDIFNAKAPISDWEKLDFVTIRSYLGLNDLVLNSKKFNETKYSIETWLKATPNYTIPWTGTGARAKRFYLMPPIRNAIAKLNKEDEIAALQARIKAIQDSSD